MPVPLRSGNPKADAKYNVTTEFPNLGLHAASASGNVGLVEYALSNGQPVNSVLDGVLPLHAACAGGNEQVVKVLLDHGADVNAPRLPTRYSSNRDATALKVGESGSTPLHFASANGHTNIVSLLLLKGARADHADKRGVTPGMLAKQEGWLECEQLLRTWLANKDKDLRERPKRTNSSGHTEEQDLRKRVQVKRSIDTALNMLKASGTNLTESYHKASPSHQTVPLSSSPPASPTSSHPQSSENLTKFGEYTFYPISPIDDRPIDPNARRPSLPHLSSDGQSLLPEPLVDGGSKSRRRIHRRPRSAGNDSNPSDTTSSRRLGPKYSFMNLFKGKDCGASTPSGVAASLSRASATGSSVSLASRENPSASTASLSRHRHRMGSDAARQGSQSLLVSSPPDSPSRPPLPLAVDLHNALAESARNAHTRDRSTSGGSSRYETGTKPVPIPMTSSNSATRSTFESGSAGSWFTGSPGSHKSTSPIARLAAVREQERTHQRDRSTSRASRDDSLRPSLMGESGYASSALRAVRYDSASSVGSGTARRDHSPGNIPLQKSPSGSSLNRPVSPTRRKRLSGSAPGVVSELEPPAIDEDEDDDYSYGHLLDSSHRRPMHTKPAPISIISNRGRGDSFTSTGSLSPILSADLGGPKLIKADFPFSLEDSPAVINESALLTANTTRSRGDSLSSMGTNTTTDDSQLLSASGFTNSSGGSATVISPSLAGLPEHPDGPIGHPPLKAGEIGIVVRSETGEPSEVHVADSSPRHISGSFKDRRNHTPEELDLRSGSDTEERVQKAKKDILDLGNDSEAADQLANLPLSARLAAFGEALEKQQRQTTMKSEPPKSASNRPPIPPRSPQRPEPVVRQQSLEAPASNRVRKRTKVPRRPHTSQGDDGTKPSPLSKSFRPLDPVNGASRQHLRSASAVEGVVLDQDDKEGDIEDFVETPITAIPSSETRKLFRSPLTPMNPPKPLTPQPSASNPRNAVADDNYVHSRVASLDIDPDGDISFGVPLTRVSTAPNAGPGSKQTARSVAQAHKLARMGFPSQEAAAASTGSYRAPSALGTATTSSSSSSKRFGGLKSWFKGSTKAV